MGDIVDVLDRNQLRIDLVEIVDKRSMTCRAEKKFPVRGTERLVINANRDRVRRLVLVGEVDVIMDTIALLLFRNHL